MLSYLVAAAGSYLEGVHGEDADEKTGPDEPAPKEKRKDMRRKSSEMLKMSWWYRGATAVDVAVYKQMGFLLCRKKPSREQMAHWVCKDLHEDCIPKDCAFVVAFWLNL